MNINYYKKYEPIEGKWYFTKELGSGAFGTVFEVERRDFSHAKSAMKIITIPSSSNEVNSYREENYDLDEKSISSYFYGFVEEFTAEFKLMSKLRGNSNIVSIEDYDVKEHEDEIGWDIFIRMELLTPINKYFKEHGLNQRDVIKLGIDICKALEVCQKYKIIHRDIKPSNIFVSDTGEFKLGDFGVARTLEKTASGLSKKGTYTYMAPEVFKGERYSSNIDIYSLGIVMYKLLNNNFEPFRTERTHADEENALACRMRGENIPGPANADGRLAEIILKACAFNPKERYESPLQMRKELQNIIYSESEAKIIYPNGDEMDYEASTTGKNYSEQTVSIFSDQATAKENQNKTVGFFDEQTALEQTESDTIGVFGPKKFTTDAEKQKVPKKDELRNRDSIHGKSNRKHQMKRITRIGIVIVLVSVLTIAAGMAFKTYFNNQNAQKVAITNISVPEDCVLAVGMQYYLAWKIEPENATEKITFQSENPQVAEIDENGLIHTMSAGITTILVKSEVIQKEVKLTVLEEPIDGTALAEQFRQAQQYLQSVLESTEIDQENVTLEKEALENVLSQYDIDSISGQDMGTLLKTQTTYQTQVLPAVENLKTAYMKAVEIEQSKQETKESSGGTAVTSQSTNGSVQKKTQSSTSTNTGSNTKASTGANTSTQDTNTPVTSSNTQAESKPQPEPESQPTCPVCGSKYHTVHPSSDAPTITKDFD